MPGPITLVLYNADVVTLDPRFPSAELVAVAGDTIAWVGSNGDLDSLRGSGIRVIDCGGGTVIPGFNDAHCHILAYASSLLAVDCSPVSVRSVADIQKAVGARVREVGPGQWVRAAGYNEFYLAERRHPTRWDLDSVSPGNPVRLSHRSGHACVLNSPALALAGITRDTPGPPQGVIERAPETGEPTGLLLEMDDLVDRAVPRLSEAELREGIRRACRSFLAWGITSAQDATESNDLDRWALLRRLKLNGAFLPRLMAMPGARYLGAFLREGLHSGAGDSSFRLGPAKVMVTYTTGALQPPEEELRSLALEAGRAGFPVAIHAVEAEAVEAAVRVLLRAQAEEPERRLRHRIEHCSECPPHLLQPLRQGGITVVTQPGFVYYHGERYLAEVPVERQPWLYRIGAFVKAGLLTAAGSDTPVAPPNPLAGMHAAVTRRCEQGKVLGAQEAVSPREALEMCTLTAAFAAAEEGAKGSIERGKLADLAVLDRNPLRVPPEEIKDIRVSMTVLGGEVVWEG